jgi:hypothetical protein
MYDAILLVSFGGPEKPEDVMPFLENVTRGRNIPHERLLEVAEHYYHFGGKSPINDQCRDLISALRPELDKHGIHLPIYWGNRNWDPFLADAMREMKAAGVKRALGLMTSAYSSYSGCRQYRENVAAAQAEIGDGAPAVDKIRVFYNHPGFIEAAVGGGARGTRAVFGKRTRVGALRRHCAQHSFRIGGNLRLRKATARNYAPGGGRAEVPGVGFGLSKPQRATHSALA